MMSDHSAPGVPGRAVEADAEPNPTLALGRYARLLLRRWRVVAAGAVLGALAATAYLFAVPSTWIAVTRVNINIVTAAPFNATRPAAELVEARAEQELARSAAVVDPVAERLGRTDDEIRAAMTATVLPKTTVMQVTYRARSPRQAATGADTLAASYLERRSAVAQAQVDDLVAKLTKRRDELRAELADERTVRSELATVVQQMTALSGVDVTGGTVLTAASDNPVWASPARRTVLATGALAGLVLGLLAAVLLHLRDPWVRDRHDVDSHGGGQVLAELSGEPVQVPVEGVDEDAIRAVREQLRSTASPTGVLVVADAAPRSDAGAVATNLGVAMAEIGVTTRVVLTGDALPDAATTGEPVSTHTFPTHPGLTLSFLAPGPEHARATAGFLDRIGAEPDDGAPLTILGCGLGSGRAELLRLGRLADRIVLVAGIGDTRSSDLGDLVGALTASGAGVVGTVLRRRA